MTEEETKSRFGWAQDFEPTETEKFILMAAAQGAPATPDPGDDVVIRAKFLQILLLGLRDDWPVTPIGVHIGKSAILPHDQPTQVRIEGRLDLIDACTADGGPIPPLVLRNCTFTDTLLLDGAHFSRLDLSGSRDLSISAIGAEFKRSADFTGAEFTGGGRFTGIRVGGNFFATDAVFRTAEGPPLRLDNADVQGNLFLDRIRVYGFTHAAGLRVAGKINAIDAQFINPGGDAFRLDGCSAGSVSVVRSRIIGQFFCTGLRIDEHFDAVEARFLNRNGYALVMQSSRIHGGVNLTASRCIGQAHFDNLDTNGSVVTRDGVFSNRPGQAMRFHNARIGGSLVLERARIRGQVSCLNSEIRGGLEADETRFDINVDRPAVLLASAKLGGVSLVRARIRGQLNADAATIDGDFFALDARFLNGGNIAVSLQSTSVENLIRFDGARILGEMFCDGLDARSRFTGQNARFCNRNGNALSFGGGAAVQGGLYLDSALVNGTLSGRGARMGIVALAGTRFKAPRGKAAIDFTIASIDLGVNLSVAGTDSESESQRPTYVTGAVIFDHARIGGQVMISGASFRKSRTGELCLAFEGAKVEGVFHSRNLLGKPDGFFDFSGAEIDSIDDDPETGWPEAGHYSLDGLHYRTIKVDTEPATGTPLAEQRIAWLKRQYTDARPARGEFRPQPFEQLAKVLREQGHDYAAMKVSIEKRELQRKFADRGFARFVHTILKITSDYGYSPARALLWFGAWVAAGAVCAKLGLDAGLFERASTDSPEASHLEPLVYAFDLSTPIIDFGQASAYRLIPACSEIAGFSLCNWREILEVGYSTIGFVLFSILVLTLSGVLRREGN